MDFVYIFWLKLWFGNVFVVFVSKYLVEFFFFLECVLNDVGVGFDLKVDVVLGEECVVGWVCFYFFGRGEVSVEIGVVGGDGVVVVGEDEGVGEGFDVVCCDYEVGGEGFVSGEGYGWWCCVSVGGYVGGYEDGDVFFVDFEGGEVSIC